MLAYAANRPSVAVRQSSPNALLVVICAHVVVIAIAMSAKMGLPARVFDPPTSIIAVPLPKPPPPIAAAKTPRAAVPPFQTHQQRQEVLPNLPNPPLPPDTQPGYGSVSGGIGETSPIPSVPAPPHAVPLSSAAQLLTAPSELKPPYPQSKLLTGEEAALTLRLTIDENGRVVAVDPVGRADSVFLAAARSYLLAHWRYKPAIQDGRAVTTSIVITLRFELDG